MNGHAHDAGNDAWAICKAGATLEAQLADDVAACPAPACVEKFAGRRSNPICNFTASSRANGRRREPRGETPPLARAVDRELRFDAAAAAREAGAERAPPQRRAGLR
jgi:hypothetical protein